MGTNLGYLQIFASNPCARKEVKGSKSRGQGAREKVKAEVEGEDEVQKSGERSQKTEEKRRDERNKVEAEVEGRSARREVGD